MTSPTSQRGVFVSPLEALAYAFLVLAGAALAGSFIVDYRRAQDSALASFKFRQEAAARRVASHVEVSFRQIYQGLRTIARLPGVRKLGSSDRILSADAQTSVQEIYNNLFQNISVSELYLVPVGFDPDEIDPATGHPQKPLMTFDTLIVGRTADEASKIRPQPQIEEIEIHEYRVMRRQLAALLQRFGTESSFGHLDYPAIASEEVVTCDNTRYSPSTPDDDRRKGVIYSVPFYKPDGKLGGMVTAVVLSDVLAELLPDDRFAIHNASLRLLLSRDRSAPWHTRLAMNEGSVGEAGLAYAAASSLSIPSIETGWMLLAAAGVMEFADSKLSDALFQRLTYEILALATTLLLGATAVRWQALRHRSIASRNRELSDGIAITTKELRIAMHEAERANAAKSQFLANVSHEIRTPIHAIISAAELAAGTPLPDPIARKIAIIRQAGHALLNLVNQVLDLSAIERGRVVLNTEQYSPSELARDSVAMLQLAAEGKGLTLRLELDSEVPESVFGDRARLQQVVLNLLDNAVRYTSVGEVVLRLYVGAQYELAVNRQLVFEISDTGPGIDPAARSEVFDSFRRGNDLAARSSSGSGLGLAIVKQLVEMMGGTISFECPPAGGTCFKVRIPFEVRSPGVGPGEAHAAVNSWQDDRVEKLGLRVLLAEDNPQMQMLMQEALDVMGCRTTLAGDGKAAIKCLESDTFDVVLMDCRMPVLDGIETTRQIRAREQASGSPAVPIIALTANAFGEDREQCLAAGMTGFLSKPFTGDDLRECLATHAVDRRRTVMGA